MNSAAAFRRLPEWETAALGQRGRSKSSELSGTRLLCAPIVAIQRIRCSALKLPFDQVAAGEIDPGSPEKI